jgi:hypothetical protein
LRELGAKLTEGDYQSALLSKKAFFKKFLKEYVLIEGTVMVVQGSDNDVRYRDELFGVSGYGDWKDTYLSTDE